MPYYRDEKGKIIKDVWEIHSIRQPGRRNLILDRLRELKMTQGQFGRKLMEYGAVIEQSSMSKYIAGKQGENVALRDAFEAVLGIRLTRDEIPEWEVATYEERKNKQKIKDKKATRAIYEATKQEGYSLMLDTAMRGPISPQSDDDAYDLVYRGTHMSPKINDGDVLIFGPQEERKPKRGDVVMIAPESDDDLRRIIMLYESETKSEWLLSTLSFPEISNFSKKDWPYLVICTGLEFA